MQNAGTDEGVAAGLRASRITSLDDALAACHALSAYVGRDEKEGYGIGDLCCFMCMTQNLELRSFRETDIITVPCPHDIHHCPCNTTELGLGEMLEFQENAVQEN